MSEAVLFQEEDIFSKKILVTQSRITVDGNSYSLADVREIRYDIVKKAPDGNGPLMIWGPLAAGVVLSFVYPGLFIAGFVWAVFVWWDGRHKINWARIALVYPNKRIVVYNVHIGQSDFNRRHHESYDKALEQPNRLAEALGAAIGKSSTSNSP